jgi:hypothetical protein
MESDMAKGPLSPEAMRILKKQRKRFLKRFGREPGPSDPVFWDDDVPGDTPAAIDPEKHRNQVLEAMEAAGTPPDVAYAYAKTGYLIVAGKEANFTPEARAEWKAAILVDRRQEEAGKLS